MRTTGTTTVTALALTVVLAGCGGGGEGDDAGDRARTVAVPSSAAAEAPEGTGDKTLTEAQLQAALLTVQDLPTGYTLAADDDDADDGGSAGGDDECSRRFDDLDAEDDTEAPSAEVEFEGGLGVLLSQEVVSHEDEDALKERFDEIVDLVSDCPSFTDTDETGATTEVAIGPLSFPKLGDDTVALALSGQAEGFDIRLNMVFVRLGRNVMSVSQGGLAADAAALEQAARTGIDKLAAAGA